MNYAKANQLRIHVNLESIKAEEAAMERWRRVLFRMMQESGQFQLNLLKEPELLLENLVKQRK